MKQIITALTTLIFSSIAMAASINVTPLLVNLTPTGKHFTDIDVTNTSNKTAYVRVKISRILHPGMTDQKRINLQGNPIKFGLVASPIRLVIPPKQLRRVRVLPLLKNNKTDALYELNITPVTGQLESLLSKGKVRAGLQVIVGYSVKVFVRPANAKAIVSILRVNNTITVKNTGNSNVLLYDGRQCTSPDNCKTLKTDSIKRLYAGNTWTFEAPKAAPVQFLEHFIKHTRILKSD